MLRYTQSLKENKSKKEEIPGEVRGNHQQSITPFIVFIKDVENIILKCEHTKIVNVKKKNKKTVNVGGCVLF